MKSQILVKSGQDENFEFKHHKFPLQKEFRVIAFKQFYQSGTNTHISAKVCNFKFYKANLKKFSVNILKL